MNAARLILACIALLALTPDEANSTDPHSQQFRLIASSPASVAAAAQSSQYQFLVIGGSGQAVGISASDNYSVVVGNVGTGLPTDRIFASGME